MPQGAPSPLAEPNSPFTGRIFPPSDSVPGTGVLADSIGLPPVRWLRNATIDDQTIAIAHLLHAQDFWIDATRAIDGIRYAAEVRSRTTTPLLLVPGRAIRVQVASGKEGNAGGIDDARAGDTARAGIRAAQLWSGRVDGRRWTNLPRALLCAVHVHAVVDAPVLALRVRHGATAR